METRPKATSPQELEVICNWREGMKFTASAGGHEISIDAKHPFGTETAMNPKELVLAGLGACTAMDVAALMRTQKQDLQKLAVITKATLTSGAQPITFRSFELIFKVEGKVDGDKLLHAVALSQSKYCGVSAMVVKAAEITYRVLLNDQEIGSGRADFPENGMAISEKV